MPPQPLHRHPEPEPVPPSRREPHAITGGGLRVGYPDVHIDTPSHTPGTQKGEEVILRTAEPGHPGRARTARSSTSINPGRRAPIDPRMPHLPPN